MQEISIVVPAYNVSNYIGRCLDSLVNQKMKNIEIIVIDDGSTDSTYEIVDSYRKKYNFIKLLRQVNSGVSAARNLGILKSLGRYIAFIDPDDWIDSEMYYTLYNEQINQNTDLVYCGYVREFDFSKHKYYEDFTWLPLKVEKEKISQIYIRHMIGKVNQFSPVFQGYCWRGLYKKDILIKNNINFHNQTKYFSEDLLFNLEYLLCCETVSFVPKHMYHYMYSSKSIVAKYNEKYWDSQLELDSKMREKLKNTTIKDYHNILNERLISIAKIAIENEFREGNRKKISEKYLSVCNIIDNKLLVKILEDNNNNLLMKFKMYKLIFLYIGIKSFSIKIIKKILKVILKSN